MLLADGLRIWDSLAIAEYLAEKPSDTVARRPRDAGAGARRLQRDAQRLSPPCAPSCRWTSPPASTRPGGCWRRSSATSSGSSAIWTDCRRAATESGPFLFGTFTIADAMFAPVCSRFTTYAVPLSSAAQAYVGQMMGLPAMREWGRLAQAELTAGGPVATRPRTASTPPPRGPVAAAPTPVPEDRPAPPVPPEKTEPEPLAAEDELRRGPRPIPSTIMVKPIGDGTRRRR